MLLAVPGMVVTDMLLDPLQNDPDALTRNRRIFRIISDTPQTVAPFLAQKMLANKKSGANIQWLTRPKLIWRFLTAPFSKRDPMREYKPGA